jgi:ABC-2 type transport system ATP-binding protein
VEAKQQYGLVPQTVNLDQELTVADNLMIHGRLFRMKSAVIRSETDRLLAYVELMDRKKTAVKNLSGGMKGRLMIARALLHSPGAPQFF